jgi:hypothetical protein
VFFGKPYEGLYSDKNVYWLGLGGTGKRMEIRDADPIEGATDIKTCEWSSRYSKAAFLQTDYLPENDRIDHWFARTVDATTAAVIELPTVNRVASKPARLTAVLFGASSSAKSLTDHSTEVKVNGVTITNFMFDGQSTLVGECEFSGSLLKRTNTIWLKQVLGEGVLTDRVFLKEISLDYTRSLRASLDSLVFNGQAGTNNYRINGFTSQADYWVLDVTQPDGPVLLTGSSLSLDKNRYTLGFGDVSEQPRRYSICHPLRLTKPGAVKSVTFAGLASTNMQADYLVLCPESFRAQAERLVEWRKTQGLSGLVVALPDIYNAFSYGIADAGAIKQFLGFAYHHWETPPQYVLLAGSGSYDPKGNLRGVRGKKEFKATERIPLHMGASIKQWTSLDGWYAQVDGTDKKVDFALGRLPARTGVMLSNMVDKIMAYEAVPVKDSSRNRALLVADKPDPAQNGKGSCETARTSFLTPGGFWCNTAYSEDLDMTVERRRVVNTLNAGVSLACYYGHGSVDRWADGILTTADVDALQNTSYPIMLMMACLTGALQNPTDGPSLMESLLSAKGGASACIANTAPAFMPSAETFAKGFLRRLATEKVTRIGDAFLGGMADLNSYNRCTQELLYLNLFADPAMVINR